MKNQRSIPALFDRRIAFLVLCIWAAGCSAPAATGVPTLPPPDFLQAAAPTAVETASLQPTAPPSRTPTARPTRTSAPTTIVTSTKPPPSAPTASPTQEIPTVELQVPSPTAAEALIPQPVGCSLGCLSEQPDCSIKGNISSEGEKIYHLPGQNFYAKTEIDPSKGERWFCSESEAVNSGWRKAKR